MAGSFGEADAVRQADDKHRQHCEQHTHLQGQLRPCSPLAKHPHPSPAEVSAARKRTSGRVGGRESGEASE